MVLEKHANRIPEVRSATTETISWLAMKLVLGEDGHIDYSENKATVTIDRSTVELVGKGRLKLTEIGSRARFAPLDRLVNKELIIVRVR